MPRAASPGVVRFPFPALSFRPEEMPLMMFSSLRSVSRRKAQRRGGNARPGLRTSFTPRLEALEDRLCLSTITVMNANDSGAGSLRAAVAAAQNGDTINFA